MTRSSYMCAETCANACASGARACAHTRADRQTCACARLSMHLSCLPCLTFIGVVYTPCGGEVLHACLNMSRTKRPMYHHVAPHRRCRLFVHASRETPDVTPCRTSPPQGVTRIPQRRTRMFGHVFTVCIRTENQNQALTKQPPPAAVNGPSQPGASEAPRP